MGQNGRIEKINFSWNGRMRVFKAYWEGLKLCFDRDDMWESVEEFEKALNRRGLAVVAESQGHYGDGRILYVTAA